MKLEHYTCLYCRTSYRADEKKCWSCGTKKGQSQPKSIPGLDRLKRKK